MRLFVFGVLYPVNILAKYKILLLAMKCFEFVKYIPFEDFTESDTLAWQFLLTIEVAGRTDPLGLLTTLLS